jgi:hypothetical protein
MKVNDDTSKSHEGEINKQPTKRSSFYIGITEYSWDQTQPDRSLGKGIDDD